MARKKKIEDVVFERLVCGQTEDELRSQLTQKLTEEEAEGLIRSAKDQIERGQESKRFLREVRSIRRRRLVGYRFLPWKILAWMFVTYSILSIIASLDMEGEKGSVVGLFMGAIILALLEWREWKIILTATERTHLE